MTIIKNEKNEQIPTRNGGECVQTIGDLTKPLENTILDQMLERLVGQTFYYFLDGYFSYNQIKANPKDHEKKYFICPFGVFSYRRSPNEL